jgi:hypothetical protein
MTRQTTGAGTDNDIKGGNIWTEPEAAEAGKEIRQADQAVCLPEAAGWVSEDRLVIPEVTADGRDLVTEEETAAVAALDAAACR